MAAVPTVTSGPLRSLILMMGVPSIFESFKNRGQKITIPRTLAADPSTKVKTLPISKAVKQDIAKAVAIDAVESTALVVVDLGPRKKTPASCGAVFTSEPDNGPCWYCRREVKPESKVGIVLRVRDDRFHHFLIIDIEGRACNTSCALKFVKDHSGEHICYEGREIAMHQINEICAPGTRLVPAPDWRLLKTNGGPLSDEDFDKEVRKFIPTSNLQFRFCELSFAPA